MDQTWCHEYIVGTGVYLRWMSYPFFGWKVVGSDLHFIVPRSHISLGFGAWNSHGSNFQLVTCGDKTPEKGFAGYINSRIDTVITQLFIELRNILGRWSV